MMMWKARNDMPEVNLSLNTIEKVKRFVTKTNSFDIPLKLKQDKRPMVDIHSIMGIFSLDLTIPVTLTGNVTEEEFEKVKEAVKDFIAKA